MKDGCCYGWVSGWRGSEWVSAYLSCVGFSISKRFPRDSVLIMLSPRLQSLSSSRRRLVLWLLIVNKDKLLSFMTWCYSYIIQLISEGMQKWLIFPVITLCVQQNHLNLHEPAVWYCYSARVIYLQIFQMIIVRWETTRRQRSFHC